MSDEFVKVDYDGSGAAARRAAEIMSKAVRAIAVRIKERTQTNIGAQDLIDTGAMLASAFIDVEGVQGRGGAVSAATSAAASPGRKSGRARKFRASPAATPVVAGPFEAKAGVAAEYAAILNDGSEGGQVKAHRFFTQAVEDTKPEIKGAVTKIAKETR